MLEIFNCKLKLGPAQQTMFPNLLHFRQLTAYEQKCS